MACTEAAPSLRALLAARAVLHATLAATLQHSTKTLYSVFSRGSHSLTNAKQTNHNVHCCYPGLRKNLRFHCLLVAQQFVNFHSCCLAKEDVIFDAGAYRALQNGVEEVDCGDDVDLQARCVMASPPADVTLEAHAARDGA
eukprot:6192384-Pleurochrysis_carterae.AAC.1